jgi:AraC-like DNA-binding protein
METDINPHHPYIRAAETIAKQEVMVLDNVTGTPVYGESYIAPDMLIIICHQGTLWNKDMPDPLFGVHDIGVLLPDQIVAAKEASADYRATMIAISRRFYNRLQHSYPYTRYAPRYRRNPATHLTDKQYDSLLNAIGLLRTLTQLDSPHRPEMLTNLLSIILNVIGEYYVSNHPDNYTLSPNELLFNRFYDALIRHHSESHEMAFYAHLCCLSPKHFSEVIKRETGTSAAEWISTYITTRAKTLLDSRKDYTIQQISLKLGFTEQASFARFFKNQTGMTPSEFRDRQ